MKYIRLFLLPVASLVIFGACQRYEFETESGCRAIFTAGGLTQPQQNEAYPGYKMVRFTGEGNPEAMSVVFVEEKRNRTRVLRHHLHEGTTETLLKRDDQIHTMDYSVSGHLAFTFEQRLFLLPSSGSSPQEVPIDQPVGNIKWRWQGEDLFCQTSQFSLMVIDQAGNVQDEYQFVTPIYDFWANDDLLMIANLDSITAYNLSDQIPQWSFSVREYFEGLGTVAQISSNGICVSGRVGPQGMLSEVLFSTPESVFSYALASGEVQSFWEQYECYVMEPGLFTSALGTHFTTTISQVQLNGRNEKQFGLLVMQPEGPNEQILFP